MAPIRSGIRTLDITSVIFGPHCTATRTYDGSVQAESGAASLLPRTDGEIAPHCLPMALADKLVVRCPSLRMVAS
ncbi:hypothetical protein P5W99_36965 [Paraburkholderia sp. A3BS-1L]|uniref:hypothetical protein n=1 Tax=Paraburkholderia sp. A3BS-1L TaxID=3028375 RepID=UPI003DA981D0